MKVNEIRAIVETLRAEMVPDDDALMAKLARARMLLLRYRDSTEDTASFIGVADVARFAEQLSDDRTINAVLGGLEALLPALERSEKEREALLRKSEPSEPPPGKHVGHREALGCILASPPVTAFLRSHGGALGEVFVIALQHGADALDIAHVRDEALRAIHGERTS